jgi:magnesium transporter
MTWWLSRGHPGDDPQLAERGAVGRADPLTLEKLKIDPAVVSTVFVTTMTDTFGFFFFLGLASIFLS